MNIDNKEVYANLPEGYLKKRKKWDLFYLWSLYAYCIFSVLNIHDIIPIKKDTSVLLLYLILGINILSVMLSFTTKRVYNNIQIPYYGEIKVFTKIEVFLYALPIIVMIPFILEKMFIYLLLVVPGYLATSMMTRPLDAIDEANKWKH